MSKTILILFFLIFLGGSALSQEITVTGTITEKDTNIPIAGASVVQKGTSNGTITNFDGEFTIDAPRESILEVSYIGYGTTEISINGRTYIDISLSPQASALDEVVIVGYGTQKKTNLTGAVSEVDMEKVLGDRPLSGAADALQGAIPGLEITPTSGRPGTSSGLNIRGLGSINGGSPLILVDNVPMDLNDINPTDIETVTVLKDAAASSIYGGRAAFGVVLITTKKGKKNQPLEFKYSNNFAFTKPTDLPEKATTLEYARALQDFGTLQSWTGQDMATWEELLIDYQNNPENYPEGSTEIAGVFYPLAEQDYYGAFMNKGFEQRHNLSFSGGEKNTSYRVSVGYANEDGILITDKDSYTKYNVNAFLKTALTSKLNASVNVFYNKDKTTLPNDWANIFRYGISHLNSTPTGTHTTEDGETYPYFTSNNILKNEKPREDFSNNIRLFGKMVYNPLEGWNITGEYTYNRSNDNRRQYFSDNEYINPLNFGVYRANNVTSYLRNTSFTDRHALNLYSNYEKSLGNHNFNVLVGFNQEQYSSEFFQVTGDEIISADVPSISTATGLIDAGDSFGEWTVLGYFGRLNYNYMQKYLLEINGRVDGSSRFPKGNRYGFFPSFSAGWVVSEESFMDSLDHVVNQFKLRVSWGEIGNQVKGSDYYPFFPGMSPINSGWINTDTGIRYISLDTPKIVSSSFSWERVRTLNLGTDIGLLDNRFTMSFDWFKRETFGMLAPGRELPSVLGDEAPLQNTADLETKGWELQVGWQDNINDFNYSFGFNVSDSRTYITKYDNPGGLLSDYYVGQEIGEIWGYETYGYFTEEDFVPGSLNEDLTGGILEEGIEPFEGYENNQNPGDIRYVDQNGDGVINDGNNTLEDPGDRKIIGNNNRRYQFGAFGRAAYKNFDFSFMLQGVGKRDAWVSNELFWPYSSQYNILYKHSLDYWTSENPTGYYPRNYPEASGNTGNSRRVQSKYLSNGAYLRVKNITFGYTFPEMLLTDVGIDKVRLYASGENLFNFDHMPDGLSTELYNINRGGSYPFLKKYSFGINISF